MKWPLSPGLYRPVIVVILLLGMPSYGDVIYLKNGNVILTERAWTEEQNLKYQTPEGIKTLPRSLVDSVARASDPPTKFTRIVAEPKTNPVLKPKPDKPVLLKSPAREAGKEVSADRITQLKKNVAEEPNSRPRREELVSALNLRAGSLLLRGQPEEALSACQEALALNPSDIPTLTNLSVIQFEQGGYRAAEETLRRAEALGGKSQTLYYLLGEAYYAQDKVQAAIDEWRRALRIQPDRGIQARLEKALSEVGTHEALEKQATRHFILRYDKQVADARLGEEILDYLEIAYRDLTRTLLDTPPETITVILYPNHAFFDITRSPNWSGAMYDGKIRIPIKGVQSLDDKLRATLSHELAHAFLALVIGDRCPAWFNEGVAQQIEGRRARQYDKVLAEAQRKKKIRPLEQLDRSFVGLSAAEAELAYAESLSAVEYIQRLGGTSAVRAILERLRARRRFGESLGEVTRLGPVDFERAWIHSLTGSVSH